MPFGKESGGREFGGCAEFSGVCELTRHGTLDTPRKPWEMEGSDSDIERKARGSALPNL